MKHSSNTVNRRSSFLKKNSQKLYNHQALNGPSLNTVAENKKEVVRQTSRIVFADSKYIKTKADEDRPE